MRLLWLALICMLFSGCFGIGLRIPESPDGGYGFDATDTNVFLYMVSIVGVAAGIAMVIWTPLKTLGGFIATMFGGIIILISVFATLIKIMPWIVGGSCLLAVGLAIIYFKSHWNKVAEIINKVDPSNLDDEAKKIAAQFKGALKGDK